MLVEPTSGKCECERTVESGAIFRLPNVAVTPNHDLSSHNPVLIFRRTTWFNQETPVLHWPLLHANVDTASYSPCLRR